MDQRTLEIEPYVSVGSARFGMMEDDVLSTFGEPKRKWQDRRGAAVLQFEGFFATVDGNGLAEISMLPDIRVVMSGTDIFASRGALGRLCRLDGEPQHALGCVVLKRLGVALTGFHDGDEAQKSISAFAKGRWDEIDLESFDQKYWV